MIRSSIRIIVFALFALPVANAQAPKGSDKLSAEAVADSLAVLAQLDSAVRANSENAAAWHRRGMVAWALAERDRYQPRIASLDRTRLGRMADTSLRLAAEIAKTNAYYRLMAGRYLLSSEASISRAASYGMFDAALETARIHSDPYTHSEAAVEAGRVYWRRYDALANRWAQLQEGDGCLPLTGAIGPSEVEKMIDQLKLCAMPLDAEVSGETDYQRAGELFQEAFESDRSNQRAYRQLAMVLVEHNRWKELAVLARARIDAAPWDAWAWLTLGLSLHRTANPARVVVAAYDSAFSLFSAEENRWFASFRRILTPEDAAKIESSDESTRFAMHRLFWISANPLWSRDASQPQLDFLSRVVFAELRWTVDEMKVRGADSDRGDVYIRYGDPDIVVARRAPNEPANPIYTTWIYKRGLVFSFVGQPTFATARIPPNDQQSYGDAIRTAPVLWPTLPGFRLDSMPVQFARFRGRADSVDIFLATRPPVESISSQSEVRGTVRSDLWLLAGGTVLMARDSVVPLTPGIHLYRRRVGSRSYMYRAEASSETSLRAARASAGFMAGDDSTTGFRTTGFSMSDVIVATAVAEPRDAVIRWSDLAITPLVGSTAANTPLSLVWENYDFASEQNAMRYGVTITLVRDSATKGRVTAALFGRIGAAVGIERADDRVTIRFERTMPFLSTRVENVGLNLGDTPAGGYTLTVEVTDRISGKITSRSSRLQITR